MKKTIVLCGLVLLSGCSKVNDIKDIVTNDTSQKPVSSVEKDTKEKTVLCTGADGEQIILASKGDKLQSMNNVFFMSAGDMGISEDEDKAAVQDTINTTLAEKYGSIQGVTTNGALQEDGRVQVTIHIDFSQADKGALVSAGLLKQGKKDSAVVSLKETEKAYSSNGYACQQQESKR